MNVQQSSHRTGSRIVMHFLLISMLSPPLALQMGRVFKDENIRQDCGYDPSVFVCQVAGFLGKTSREESPLKRLQLGLM